MVAPHLHNLPADDLRLPAIRTNSKEWFPVTINFIDLPETLRKPLEELKPLLSYSVGEGSVTV